MSDLKDVYCEYCHSRVDTEALQAWEDCVGPDEEGDDVREGGDRHRHAGVFHGLAEPLLQSGRGGREL